MPIYFSASYKGFLYGGVRAEHSKPYPKGAPFYHCVDASQQAIKAPQPSTRGNENASLLKKVPPEPCHEVSLTCFK